MSSEIQAAARESGVPRRRSLAPTAFERVLAYGSIVLLAVVALTQAPMLAWHARQHRVDAHRFTVISLVTGALLIARAFTFPFGRMLGRWLLG